MIGGLMMFSIQVLDALDRLGMHMTEEGTEAYYYSWRVVGAILGFYQSAAPPDLVSAREFSDKYMTRHMGPSPEGVNLTQQLIDLYVEVVPGTAFDPLVGALIRYLVGDTMADWLKVPRSRWNLGVQAVPPLLKLLERLEDSGPVGAWLLDRTGNITTRMQLSSLTRG